MEQSGKSRKRLDKRGWEGYNATIPRMPEERTDGTMKKLRTNMMMLGMCMGSMCMRRCANSGICSVTRHRVNQANEQRKVA